MQRRNILVVYSAYPTRATLQDGILCFGRYATDRVFYLNVRARNVPHYVRKVRWDLIVFPTLFFAARHDAEAFRKLVRRVAPLAQLNAHKAIIPQDEFINSNVVNEFIREFGIRTVFSCQPQREWDNIYGPAVAEGVRIVPVLTGYLDDVRMRMIAQFRKPLDKRTIDIGYRTGAAPLAWWGRHGYAKYEIARVFEDGARRFSLATDISYRSEDTLLGDRWYEFLGNCKYQLGVESGTSILDRDGSIKARTEAFVAANPSATFEQIEAASFPGIDGSFTGFAISPRHLESCAAGTCQVLIEGEYNGILRPHEHYIPVKRDWSNVDEVLNTIQQDQRRAEIVERAHQDIVESGKYTYRSFVDTVIAQTIGAHAASRQAEGPAVVVHAWMRGLEHFDRSLSKLYGSAVVPMRQRLLGH
jgi:hypothetical protein